VLPKPQGHGKKGEEWIANLPTTIDTLTHHWKLHDLVLIDNKTFHYVVKATTHAHQPVVLKIGCDAQSILYEKEALNYFDGDGSVRLIDYDATHHALLLQQAIPGTTLTSLTKTHVDDAIDCYISVMKKLHTKPLPKNHTYRHISEWLTAIDKLIPNHPCPSHLLEKAIILKNRLVATMTREVFLHGDLHPDNLLKHGDQWLAIDPKGIIGEPEFEIAAFDFMFIAELASKTDAKTLIESNITLLAQKADLNAQRLKDWVFVRLILMAAWHVEDNGDPLPAITLAERLYE
jgi:streptomycin 6-kinase